MAKVNIMGLGHISMCVNDLEKAKAFYSEVFGFKPLCTSIGEKDHSTMCFLTNGEITLELMGFETPPNRQDGLIDHLCFRVEDIQKAAEALQKCGYALDGVVEPDSCIYENGGLFMIFRGPNGERLQLEQRL